MESNKRGHEHMIKLTEKEYQALQIIQAMSESELTQFLKEHEGEADNEKD